MREIRVVGAAIRARGRCLVALRGPGMTLAGSWEFPGGKVEHGERPEDALRREVLEELGAEVEVGARLGQGSAVVGDRRIRLDVYAAHLLRGEPRATEHAELRWVTPEELDELHWAEADVPSLDAVRRWLLADA